LQLLQSWSGLSGFDTKDREVAEWYETDRKAIGEKVDALKAENLALEVAEVVRGQKAAGWKGVREVLRVMPVEERDAILKYLKE
jgi:acetyl-CoA carboxylase/biotin carboxylase 1